MKVGSGIGTSALGWVLGAGGFDSTLATQSASAISAINWSFAWIPSITMIVAVICLILFDLDKYYDRVVDDLSKGIYKKDGEIDQ